jgi:hypothetical protein
VGRLAILCALGCAASSGCTLLLSFDEPAAADLSVPDLALTDGGCGTDGGWAMLCSGACVDTSSDPSNCGVCGKTCASGRCGLALPPLDPSTWSFNGSAAPTDGGVLLTAPDMDLTGTVFFDDLIPVDDVTTSFRFKIIPAGSANCDAGITGDGLAWAIQTMGATAKGDGRDRFGVVPLPGYAVEVDTFDDPGCDQPVDHVAIDWTDAPCDAGQPVMLAVYSDGTGGGQHALANCQWHTCEVTVKSGALSVKLDGKSVLATQLPNLAGAYYIGFGGATGGNYSQQEVSDVAVTFPAPRCL